MGNKTSPAGRRRIEGVLKAIAGTQVRVSLMVRNGLGTLAANGKLYRGPNTDECVSGEWRVDLEGFTVCFDERDEVEIQVYSTSISIIRLITNQYI